MNAYMWMATTSLCVVMAIALWEDVTGFRNWYE